MLMYGHVHAHTCPGVSMLHPSTAVPPFSPPLSIMHAAPTTTSLTVASTAHDVTRMGRMVTGAVSAGGCGNVAAAAERIVRCASNDDAAVTSRPRSGTAARCVATYEVVLRPMAHVRNTEHQVCIFYGAEVLLGDALGLAMTAVLHGRSIRGRRRAGGHAPVRHLLRIESCVRPDVLAVDVIPRPWAQRAHWMPSS